MGSEVKPGRAGLKSWAQRHLNAGFVVGFFLVLLTYFVVSRQFAISAPNAVTTTQAPRRIVDRKIIRAPENTEGEEKREQERQPKAQDEEEPHKDTHGAVPAEEFPERDDADAKPFGAAAAEETGKVVCTTHGPYSDTCDLDGDVRINGTALSVTLVPTSQSTEHHEWKVPPYPRKNMLGISDVTVTQLASPSDAAPACTVTHDTPAVVFALGGLTGNYWHDFSDVLVPLFCASRRYAGDVLFLVSNVQPWWLGKYEAVVRRLSRHDAVDLDRDDKGQVRCFRRHVTVGLRMHKELSIVPDWAEADGGQRLTMADFTAFLREAYALPRAAPASPDKKKKPRLMLIHRGHYRRFVNVQEVARAAEAAGFEAVVTDPRGDAGVGELARSVNSFDVLLGVHGAGLTNAVFLPAGAVVIQVVPYGKLERMARTDFGEPVADMGLKYLEYSVAKEESTLLEMLGPEHPVIKDPEAVHRSGWDKVAEFYLGKQDVRINVTRFAPVLEQAMQHLRQQQQQ